jgi:hypothetical protein
LSFIWIYLFSCLSQSYCFLLRLLLLLNLAFEHGVCAVVGCFCTSRRGDGVLGAREGESWLGWHFVLLRWERRTKNWTGLDQERRNAYTGCKDWKRAYIKSDCTVRRACNCYVMEFGRHSASAGADITIHSYFAKIEVLEAEYHHVQ